MTLKNYQWMMVAVGALFFAITMPYDASAKGKKGNPAQHDKKLKEKKKEHPKGKKTDSKAEKEHGKAGQEHGKAGQEHGKAGEEHGKAGEEHGKAIGKHGKSGKIKLQILADRKHGKHKKNAHAKEQRKHLRRLAKIDRLIAVATNTSNVVLLSKVNLIKEKEIKRHQKAFERITQKKLKRKGKKIHKGHKIKFKKGKKHD